MLFGHRSAEDDAQLASFMGTVFGALNVANTTEPAMDKFPRISNRPVQAVIARSLVISRTSSH